MVEIADIQRGLEDLKSMERDLIDGTALGVLALAGMTKVTIVGNKAVALYGPVVVMVHPKVAARLRELTKEGKIDG